MRIFADKAHCNQFFAHSCHLKYSVCVSVRNEQQQDNVTHIDLQTISKGLIA